MIYYLIGAVVIVALPLLINKKDAKKKDSDVEYYEKQKVKFYKDGESYTSTLKKEIEGDRPHFDTLRQVATKDVKGADFIGIKMEDQTWLFPVSQRNLKEIYSMTGLGGKMEVTPFSHAVGYAPDGMPFIASNEHWKELRTNVAAIFQTDFMNAYLQHFNTAVKELVADWKTRSGKSINVYQDILNMAYNSAVFSLIGSKLDVDVPYHGPDGESTLHIRDVNTKTLNAFAKHAATVDFMKDTNYRLASDNADVKNLNENMGTLAGALTGLVNARVAEITGGAESHLTIVDAAISLTLKGVIKSVGEAIQHGWAILNGAHLNCGSILAATLFYLLKNPAVYKKLHDEINKELLKGKTYDANGLEKLITRDNLKELEYLNFVVKEALRLSSPIYGKPLKATEDMELDGLKLKKGTYVYPNNAVIGVSQNIWKDPLEFIPERFDPDSEYFKLPDGKKRDPITWLAFGGGARTCMGDNYSMYFVKVGLVYFMHLFDFKLESDPKVDSFFYWLNRRDYNAKVTAK